MTIKEKNIMKIPDIIYNISKFLKYNDKQKLILTCKSINNIKHVLL